MKKRLLVVCALLVLVPLYQAVLAVEVGSNHNFAITYTADNYVNNWWLRGGGSTTLLPTGSNQGVWQQADTHSLNLDIAQSYELIWEVFNLPGSGGGYSPAGFLAEIETTVPIASGSLLSSDSWFVALPNSAFNGSNFGVLDWRPASPYGSNIDPNNPWIEIAGIDDSAEWIWTKNNDENTFVNNHALVKAVLQTTVPIPSAAWLLGAGLVGLVAVRRKFSHQDPLEDLKKKE